MLISLEIWSLQKTWLANEIWKIGAFTKQTFMKPFLTKLWAKESNSLLKNVLGWNMKRSGFNSNGVCKNFTVHSPHPEKETVNTLQEFLITKTTLFILIFSFKRQFCHTVSFNYNHTYSFRLNYWTTTFTYKKELKIEMICVIAIIFPLRLQEKQLFCTLW